MVDNDAPWSEGIRKTQSNEGGKGHTDVIVEPAASALAAYTPVEAAPVAKPRKSYPSTDERITMADKQIERLTALRSSREALVAKTESLLSERQKALASCAIALEKAEAKKERLVAARNKPVKAPKAKLTTEERKAHMAAGRAAKKAEKEKYDAVVAAIQASGKTLDEFIAEMNAE